MRVPDDVTLLFADDNWGNIRRLPDPADRTRPGGYGVYYHFDYVGGPRNYKWINTNPDRASLGADATWRTRTAPTGSGSSTSATSSRWSSRSRSSSTSRGTRTHGRPSACRSTRAAGRRSQFGDGARARDRATAHASTPARNARRKPELLDPTTYSLANYHEAERVVAEYDALRRARERSASALPPEYRDAYYQLVLHPIAGVRQPPRAVCHGGAQPAVRGAGPGGDQRLADSARRLFARDAEIRASTTTSSPAASGAT